MLRKTRSAETAEVARTLQAQKTREAEHGPAQDTFDREAISADVICFGSDGGFRVDAEAFVTPYDLPAAGSGSFSIDLYGNACPVGLVAASGYGHF